MKPRWLWSLTLAFLSTSSAWAMPIALNNIGGAAPGTQAGDAFALAAQRVGSLFSNPATIFIDVGFSNLGPGILGSTSLTYLVPTYASIRGALIANANPFSVVDQQAIANLPTGPNLDFRTNQSDGSIVRDNDGSINNSRLAMAQANGRALGIFTGAGSDATIQFSNLFTWDFDPSDGITAGAFDFVGVASHEIMHALGFVSGVDTVDQLSGPSGTPTNLNGFAVFSTLDLFRYSSDSVLLGSGILDLAYGGTPYFSLDQGATSLGTFSTGARNGDGRQASHWKDGLNLGIMDPTLGAGELGIIRQLDPSGMQTD